MKTLEERITEAESALEEAKASDDAAKQASAEARLEAYQEAKEFHTKEFERVGKKMRSEGGEAREKAIADEFGVSLEEAKQMIADYREIQVATETETETERKAREKAEGERDEAKQREADALKLADRRFVESEAKIALVEAGVNASRIPKLLSDPDLPTPAVEDEKVTGTEAFVEAAKKEYPEWFGNGKLSGFDGVPPGDPDGATKEQEQANKEIAARQIHRMF